MGAEILCDSWDRDNIVVCYIILEFLDHHGPLNWTSYKKKSRDFKAFQRSRHSDQFSGIWVGRLAIRMNINPYLGI